MTDNENKNMGVSLEDLSQIFAPSWARRDDASENATRIVTGNPDRPQKQEQRRGDRPQRRHEDGEFRAKRPVVRRENDSRQARFENKPKVEQQPPLSLDIRFLPQGKALSAIIKTIQTSRRAYPVRDIVKLFRKDDASISVRIESTGEKAIPLYQCRACGMPDIAEAGVVNHLLSEHLKDYFDIDEIEVDPPSGNFPYVAKCGITGEFLGPPNHHSFAIRVQEMLQTKVKNMSEAEYRKHIETVRDPEAVEAWRQSCRKQTIYRLKATKAEKTLEGEVAEAPQEEDTRTKMSRREAESYFRREIMPSLLGKAQQIVCPATSLKNLPCRQLANLLNQKFAEEENPFIYGAQVQEGEKPRSPRGGTLFAAVHAAFFNSHLTFFRANNEKGQEFVTAVSFNKTVDIEHALPEIKAAHDYVKEHPSCSEKELLSFLNPNNDETKTKSLLLNIKWLIDNGCIIQFFNGALTLPAEHPIFRNQKQKKEVTPAEGKQAETSAEAPAPAPEAEAAPQPTTEEATPNA